MLGNEDKMNKKMNLGDLKAGDSAKIISVGGEGALRQHFLDMGLIKGTTLSLIKLAPMGDPLELQLHGYDLTLRLDDAKKIEVEPIVSDKTPKKSKPHKSIPHPGFGEYNEEHKKEHHNPLPDDEVLTFALVGNQNCGKTTLFNRLTGSNQHVGNFPGVTVDRKDGVIKGPYHRSARYIFNVALYKRGNSNQRIYTER